MTVYRPVPVFLRAAVRPARDKINLAKRGSAGRLFFDPPHTHMRPASLVTPPHPLRPALRPPHPPPPPPPSHRGWPACNATYQPPPPPDESAGRSVDALAHENG